MKRRSQEISEDEATIFMRQATFRDECHHENAKIQIDGVPQPMAVREKEENFKRMKTHLAGQRVPKRANIGTLLRQVTMLTDSMNTI